MAGPRAGGEGLGGVSPLFPFQRAGAVGSPPGSCPEGVSPFPKLNPSQT